MTKKFYLTTPLYSVDVLPHVGHVYTTIIADAVARYRRLCGHEVCFLTGTDEHGQRIEKAALEAGMNPKQVVELHASAFQKTWKRLGIAVDRSIRTTASQHEKTVHEIFQKLLANGFIYSGEPPGRFCASCETFCSDQESCPECSRDTEPVSEETHFFKLSAFQKKLLEFYQDNPTFVLPSGRMNEVISLVKAGLTDLIVSRRSFHWGIPVPGNEQFVFAAWFDSLLGYLSGIDYSSDQEVFEKFWPADVQLIGRELLRLHAVYWPAFLMAAGMEPARHILVNGWWTIQAGKASQTEEDLIAAEPLIRLLKPDYIRYFLLREVPLGNDGNFSLSGLAKRVNSDLVDEYAKLASRLLRMMTSYFDGLIPEAGELEGADHEVRAFCRETVQLYRENFDRFQINRALDNVWELISVTTKYLLANEPEVMRKDAARRERLGTILYNAAQALRIASVLLSPIIPDGAQSVLRQLGDKIPPEQLGIGNLNWGDMEPGVKITGSRPVYSFLEEPTFEQLEQLSREAAASRDTTSSQVGFSESGSDSRIEIQEFLKVDMRVGRILSAEPIAKSSKLLKLQVDIGDQVRQVVAGIGNRYKPADLAGRLVVVVVNLKPVSLLGVESNGMIVAASDAGEPVLASFSEAVRVGSRLK